MDKKPSRAIVPLKCDSNALEANSWGRKHQLLTYGNSTLEAVLNGKKISKRYRRYLMFNYVHTSLITIIVPYLLFIWRGMWWFWGGQHPLRGSVEGVVPGNWDFLRPKMATSEASAIWAQKKSGFPGPVCYGRTAGGGGGGVTDM